MTISVFVCYTPYHLLLAQALADGKSGESLIVFIDEAESLDKHPELWISQKAALELLPRTEFQSLQRRWCSRFKSVRHLARIARDLEQKYNHVEIYACNFRREESQFFASRNWQSQTKSFLIEDGAGIYWDEHAPPTQSLLQKTPKKLIYWNYIELTEYSDRLTPTGVLALHPDLVIPCNYPTTSIRGIDQTAFRNTVNRIASSMQLDFEKGEGICISLQNTARYTSKQEFDNYVAQVKVQIEAASKNKNEAVYLKLHPRELHPDRFPKFAESTIVLPKSIPFEVIIAILPKKTTYLCPWSTVVTSGLVINPHATFVVTASGRDARAAQRFSALYPQVILRNA
jgi:hypothetical protein